MLIFYRIMYVCEVSVNCFFFQKELERFTTINITESRREWTDKWVPKIVEQAKLETMSCSAASISCAQVIALGKRLYNKTLTTLEVQGSN